jgi:hypothetical protein
MGKAKTTAEHLPSTTLASGNQLQQPALRTPPGGQELTPRRAARLLLPPLSWRAHLPPRTSLLISCRSTQSWLSFRLDYYTKYYSGRLSTYRLDRTIVTAGAPRMLAMSTSPPSAGASSCASAAATSSAAMVPLQVVLQGTRHQRDYSSNDYSTRGYGYLPPLAGARRSTLGPGTPCTVACP